MKDLLAVIGVVLLILCGLLSLLTVQTGGVRHVDEAGRTTEVLTWQGWQPPGAKSEPAPPTPVPAVAVVPPTWTPAPPVAPTAAPRQPSPVPLVADAGGGTGNDAGAPARAGVSGVAPAGANPAAERATTRFSPWEVVGWTLAGLVPAGGVSALALVIYRQVALTRARAAALRAAGGGPASVPPPTSGRPAGQPPAPGAALPDDSTEEGQETDVAVFLRAVTTPPAVPAGGE